MTVKKNEPTPLAFIFRYLDQYRWHMIAGIIYIAIATVFQLLTPWLLKFAIDFIAASFQHKSSPFLFPIPATTSTSTILLMYAGLIVLATVLQGVFRYLMRYTMIGVSRKIEYKLRNDYFAHLQKLSQTFYHRHQTGDLMARATNDLEAVRSMIGPGIMQLVSTIFVGGAAIILLFKISVSLTLWALLPMPFIAFTAYKILGRIDLLWGRIQAQFSSITAKVEENLSGIRVIKSYVREDHEIKDFQKLNLEYIKRNLALIKVQAFLHSTIQLLLSIGIMIILFVGGSQVSNGTLTIGGLISFFSYCAILAWPMIALGWTLNLWQQGLASMKRMMHVWEVKPAIADSENTDANIRVITGDVEFRDVTFGYDGDDPIVHNISLKIPAGTTLAIVGPTGSGKSTLIQLLVRLYDVQKGAVLIDGHDVRTIPLRLIRTRIGYVPQETFLFSDTLQENIAFGIHDPGAEALEDATVISQLRADFDQFPEGFQTLVGERGITLSGGQKQRTAISRAIIKKPAILILDDALSAVDTQTEEEILKQLKRVMRQCTGIIISHRISTVRHAHQIIVLDNGRIVEQGKHSTLLKKRGLYFKLYQRQMLEKSLEKL
jgi:ATP-binding cassette, subfamily B, multidrug efflux pump